MPNVIGRNPKVLGYLQEHRSAGSGTNGIDIITVAMSTYQSIDYKPFKYLNVWQEVRHHMK